MVGCRMKKKEIIKSLQQIVDRDFALAENYKIALENLINDAKKKEH